MYGGLLNYNSGGGNLKSKDKKIRGETKDLTVLLSLLEPVISKKLSTTVDRFVLFSNVLTTSNIYFLPLWVLSVISSVQSFHCVN